MMGFPHPKKKNKKNLDSSDKTVLDVLGYFGGVLLPSYS